MFQSFDRDFKVLNKGNSLFDDITRSLANLVRKKQESVEHLYRETEKLVEASRYDNSAFDLVNAKRLDPRLGPYPHPDGCLDEQGNLRVDKEGTADSVRFVYPNISSASDCRLLLLE